jgi:fermentation-respiration switch protein FrsA (DUF1100 family)
VRAALLALLAIALSGCGLQDWLLYFPDKTRPDPATTGVAAVREVSLETADGITLRSWWLPPREGRPVIAYFHGNGGNIGHRAIRVRRFAEAGLGLLMLEYRGYGGNPGRPSEAGLFADARAALAFLDRAGIPAGQVVLWGESLGSGVAVAMASEQPVGAVVLEASYTRLEDVAAMHYPAWLVRLALRDRFDSLSRIAAVKAPLLVLHGEQDTIIPVALGRALFAAANEPKEGWFAPQGGHNDLREHGGVDQALDFVRRRLGGDEHDTGDLSAK